MCACMHVHTHVCVRVCALCVCAVRCVCMCEWLVGDGWVEVRWEREEEMGPHDEGKGVERG